MIKRVLDFNDLGDETCFLWGPRQCGKSTLLKARFPFAPYYNLLLSREYARLTRDPSLLRQEILGARPSGHVIIDEIQRVPELLNEVQDLIVAHGMKFILCGSSARKLKRGGGNLLGGRALKYNLFPFVSNELKSPDIERAVNHGLVPRHYLGNNPGKMLQAYVDDYLKEEIAAEGLVRNLPSFARFLEVAAISNGEIVVYNAIAGECGVSAPTVKEYFQILVDTLVGRYVPAFQMRPKRRVIASPRFYYFDVGIANHLLKRPWMKPGTELFGRAFEHFIFQELVAHGHYGPRGYKISYWRTASGFEVDFILGDADVAIEAKAAGEISSRHLKGLRAFAEEYPNAKPLIVSLDERPRQAGSIAILPWREFLKRLWAGEII